LIRNLLIRNLLFFFTFCTPAHAASTQNLLPTNISLEGILNSPQFSNSIQMLLALTVISLIPFILISVTSFIRIIIVFGMVRVAVGTQQVPPNQVLIGLAFFLTVFIMSPVWQEINLTAITPYNQGKISQAKAFDLGMKPVRNFMFRQTREADLALFINFSKIPKPKNIEEVPIYVMIPAFMISELKTAFQISFILFVPFLIIDLVISNILLSLGMFMLSPVMVSLPFKILLFVLADGWNLITQGLLMSFR